MFIYIPFTFRPTELNSNENIISSDAALQAVKKSGIPVWTTITNGHVQKNHLSICGDTCVDDGLSYAHHLGYSRNLGFASVFKNLNPIEFIDNTFSYYVALVFSWQ